MSPSLLVAFHPSWLVKQHTALKRHAAPLLLGEHLGHPASVGRRRTRHTVGALRGLWAGEGDGLYKIFFYF